MIQVMLYVARLLVITDNSYTDYAEVSNSVLVWFSGLVFGSLIWFLVL